LLTCGCGNHEKSDDPWDGRAQQLPCGFDPEQCLDVPGDHPGADELIPPQIGFRKYVETADYVDPARAACPNGYVYDLPRDKLLGYGLAIDSLWSQSTAPPNGLESCADYAATLHVYAVDPDASSGYRFVDHRIFKGQADSAQGWCGALIDSAGPGEAGQPHNETIWLTPRSYPFGLRIVSSVSEACEPLRISFQLAEGYPSQPQPPEQGTQ